VIVIPSGGKDSLLVATPVTVVDAPFASAVQLYEVIVAPPFEGVSKSVTIIFPLNDVTSGGFCGCPGIVDGVTYCLADQGLCVVELMAWHLTE
jgi:hypothetical protein